MFFPIRTDRQLKRTPWVNYTLIAATVGVFLLTGSQVVGASYLMQDLAQQLAQRGYMFAQVQELVRQRVAAEYPVVNYYLVPLKLHLYQFITYQFLHAGWEHLLGNMLFLYVFGNSVEDRLGRAAYLAFYLAGGVVAGLGHVMVEDVQVLGASGAVAAVSGAYLVLFPFSNVTILYWFFFIGTFEISSLWMILLQIAQDAFMYLGQYGGVAYAAHLSGYAYGMVLGMAMLGTRLLAREPFDLFTLLERRRRRAQFAAMTRNGYQPWLAGPPGAEPPPPQPVDATSPGKILAREQIMALRGRISAALASHDLPGAANLYAQLLRIDPSQVMGQDQQLDLANQFMVGQRYEDAARAYELYLNTYKNPPRREEVELILGLIYVRYLARRQRARELLTAALSHLRDPTQIELARGLLMELSA
jgi:membrane associated rhomboid family serine protease